MEIMVRHEEWILAGTATTSANVCSNSIRADLFMHNSAVVWKPLVSEICPLSLIPLPVSPYYLPLSLSVALLLEGDEPAKSAHLLFGSQDKNRQRPRENTRTTSRGCSRLPRRPGHGNLSAFIATKSSVRHKISFRIVSEVGQAIAGTLRNRHTYPVCLLIDSA